MNVHSKDFTRLAIIPEPEWENLGKNLLQHAGSTVVIGAINSGKSTLIQYLLRRFIENRTTIALVDTDIGQSSLGIPGTITMKVFKKPKDIEAFHAEETFFVGSLNPAQKIPMMIEGTKILSQKAREKSDFKEGTVIGLNTNEDTKALGILLETDNSTITFKSPTGSLRGINRVVLGDITLND